ncbi:MAG TPA: glycoside hydrolase family 127 protein, partial [Candidatus Merdenecus merdavium]|nr:glycoside hydrolase family 127 protein [Candidatus Merdenecus merdavium]
MENTRLLQKAECVIEGSFWNRYIEIVRDKVIPYQWDILNDRIEGTEPSHAIENFKIAAKEKEGNFYGEIFQDSDLYKWLEAVGNILMLQRDEELEKYADEVIELIGRAQEPDGYLNTYFTIEEPDKKWT